MRLAIADPPYPPFNGSGGRKNRASRWYGDKQRSIKDRPADNHASADVWDDITKHRELLLQLLDEFDGFAIATSPDGIAAYHPLPIGMRILAWIKPNAIPGAHRIKSSWEPVLIFPPIGRRSNRQGVGMTSDILTANAPRVGFHGAKPETWTHWVLDALSFDKATDTVVDMFPGSGQVARAIETYRQ
jgi:hypothetical protein